MFQKLFAGFVVVVGLVIVLVGSSSGSEKTYYTSHTTNWGLVGALIIAIGILIFMIKPTRSQRKIVNRFSDAEPHPAFKNKTRREVRKLQGADASKFAGDYNADPGSFRMATRTPTGWGWKL